MKRYVALLLLCFVALLPTRAFAQAQHDKPAVSIDLSDVKDPQELQRRIAALADAGAERILAYDIDVKVNADNSKTAAQLNIRGIPTLVCFTGGREVARQAGLMSRDGILAWVRARAAAPTAAQS